MKMKLTWKSRLMAMQLTFVAIALSIGTIPPSSVHAQSPVIASIAPEGDPIIPFGSNGDLWLNTWADDGDLYSGWGDGAGIGPSLPHKPSGEDQGGTDCGIAQFTGTLPNIHGKICCYRAPKTNGLPKVNDKPSSMLYLDGQLVGAFHSPLGNAWIGYLAVSHDYGATWQRIGFYKQGETPPANASPWTRDRNSNFRCLFFINMGQAYRLNKDGYVYAMAIGTEWNWTSKKVYLCRVPRKDILDYSAYRYFTGLTGSNPGWSASQDDARPLPVVRAGDQGSAMFHPQLGRYLFLTDAQLYDAAAPWGPWTLAGTWNGKTNTERPIQWRGGYMPGIISKDTGPDWFWFTIAGQNKAPKVTYQLHLGKMHLVLRHM